MFSATFALGFYSMFPQHLSHHAPLNKAYICKLLCYQQNPRHHCALSLVTLKKIILHNMTLQYLYMYLKITCLLSSYSNYKLQFPCSIATVGFFFFIITLETIFSNAHKMVTFLFTRIAYLILYMFSKYTERKISGLTEMTYKRRTDAWLSHS